MSRDGFDNLVVDYVFLHSSLYQQLSKQRAAIEFRVKYKLFLRRERLMALIVYREQVFLSDINVFVKTEHP